MSSLAVVEHLLIDSVGFINCPNPTALGRTLYSVEAVLAEIRDAKNKERLRSLPVPMTLIQPDSECLKLIVEFAKDTGDYASLSKADLVLIAAAYTLKQRHVDELHCEPVDVAAKGKSKIDKDQKEPQGFYTPVDLLSERLISSLDLHNEQSESDECIANLDDEHGWVTEENIGSMDLKCVKVACLTSDFAVQNVLAQMGVNVVSPDGRTIQRLRTYVLRCFSCFSVTTNVSRKFCPNCGYKTLTKLTVSYNEDGDLIYHFSKNKIITARGSKYSLPAFKGGKHAKNPVLFEDQPVSENKLSKKARQRVDVFHPDYVAGDSPFAVHDLYSRSAVLAIRSLHRRDRTNPNEYASSRKRGGKRR